MDNARMAQWEKPPRKDFVTKELFIMLTPILASCLWTIFYQGGFAQYYGIPIDFIDLSLVDILLTNRLTLLAATIAFLWIGLYYNLIPSAGGTIFKAMVTVLLVIAISLGFVFGRVDAMSKQEYLVANTEPESVVLQIYEDTLITAPLDRVAKTVQKSFTVRKIGDSRLELSVEKVGPLISEGK